MRIPSVIPLTCAWVTAEGWARSSVLPQFAAAGHKGAAAEAVRCLRAFNQQYDEALAAWSEEHSSFQRPLRFDSWPFHCALGSSVQGLIRSRPASTHVLHSGRDSGGEAPPRRSMAFETTANHYKGAMCPESVAARPTAEASSEPRFSDGFFAGLRVRAEAAFDRLYGPERRALFRKIIVYLALGGLVVHAVLVFLARSLEEPSPLVQAVGTNYLAALYTPFSFVLFYEVLLLILSIPESTTRSIGKQYEILSLIVIRNVFKDIAEFESVTDLSGQVDEFGAVLLDMGGGLLMFLLVAVFYHVAARCPRTVETDPGSQDRVQVFIGRKKVIALALSALLFGLAAYNLARWGIDVSSIARFSTLPTIDVRTIFYLDLFTVMIFADAVILLLSLLLAGHYELVFRNAAFVVSTILLRFSLAVQKPYDVELGLVSIAFGTLVLLTYAYYQKYVVGPKRRPFEGAA